MQQQRIKIEKIVSGGYGLGYVDGRVVLVPHTAPGDEVLIEDNFNRRGVSWGSLISILSPSASRISPICAQYTHCGGCQLQHIVYAVQPEYKRLIVEDALTRISGFKDIKVDCCIGSPESSGYRNRVRLHCGGRELGFYKVRSNVIQSIKSCPMLSTGINKCLEQVSHYLSSHPLKYLSGVEMLEDSHGQVMLTLHTRSFPGAGIVEGLRKEVSVSGAVAVVKHRTKHLWGEKVSVISVEGKVFRISPGAFFQSNSRLLPALIHQVVKTIPSANHEMGLELYAGVGLFSTMIAGTVNRLLAVEWNQHAAEDAKANLRANQIDNVEVVAVSAEDALAMLLSENARPELVVMDPPREGLSDTVSARLLGLAPQQIIYISCDPATLARDLKQLCGTGGYAVQAVTPLDMFPHTSHIECVCSLVR